jgi:hypothetical protein
MIAYHTFYDYLRRQDSTKYSVDIGDALTKSLDFLIENKFIVRKEKKQPPKIPGKLKLYKFAHKNRSSE